MSHVGCACLCSISTYAIAARYVFTLVASRRCMMYHDAHSCTCHEFCTPHSHVFPRQRAEIIHQRSQLQQTCQLRLGPLSILCVYQCHTVVCTCATYGGTGRSSGMALYLVRISAMYAVFGVVFIALPCLSQSHSLLSRSFYTRLIGTRDDIIFMSLWLVYTCFCINVMHDTYVWGFHSARQCAYGAALALGAQVRRGT